MRWGVGVSIYIFIYLYPPCPLFRRVSLPVGLRLPSRDDERSAKGIKGGREGGRAERGADSFVCLDVHLDLIRIILATRPNMWSRVDRGKSVTSIQRCPSTRRGEQDGGDESGGSIRLVGSESSNGSP